MNYQNKEGSTGTLKDGVFVPFASQAEADKSLKPAQAEPEAEPAEAPAKKK